MNVESICSRHAVSGRIAMMLIAAPITLLAAPPLVDRFGVTAGGDSIADGIAPRHANTPNIVTLLTDDLDVSVWDKALALGYLPRIRSDVIDKGVTLTNTFAATPVCCPSRTTLLTGQYPHNHGVLRNDRPKGGFAHFDNDASTIAVWLHDAGYRTGILGKYLNGYTVDDVAYVAPGWETWSVVLDIKEYDYRMSMNGTLVFHGDAPQDYQTDVLAGMARDFILKSDSRPFLLLLTPTAPHYEIGVGVDVDENDCTIIRPAPRYADTPAAARRLQQQDRGNAGSRRHARHGGRRTGADGATARSGPAGKHRPPSATGR